MSCWEVYGKGTWRGRHLDLTLQIPITRQGIKQGESHPERMGRMLRG